MRDLAILWRTVWNLFRFRYFCFADQ